MHLAYIIFAIIAVIVSTTRGINHKSRFYPSDFIVHADPCMLAASSVVDRTEFVLGTLAIRHFATEHARPRRASRSRSAYGDCVPKREFEVAEMDEVQQSA